MTTATGNADDTVTFTQLETGVALNAKLVTAAGAGRSRPVEVRASPDSAGCVGVESPGAPVVIDVLNAAGTDVRPGIYSATFNAYAYHE